MITTQDFILESVIHQNQKTIDWINAQEYGNAVVSSSSTLQYHRSIIAMQSELLHHRTPTQSELTCDQCILLTNTDGIDGHETVNQHSFIYDQGIQIPAGATTNLNITAIAIFNAALAHQLLASQQQCNNELLHHAKRLYSLAYDSTDLDENPLFQFVIINNLAVVERDLGNEGVWDQSMEYLLLFYMTLLDAGCTTILRRVQGFLLNALPSSPIAHVA